MAYRFDGVDDMINFGVGALSAQLAGPCTMAVCVNLSATTDGAAIHLLTSGDASGAFLECFGSWDMGIGATARTGPAGVTGSWRIIVFSKATGAASVEWTQIILGGATTSGTATGGTLTDGATAPGGTGKIRVGRFQASATEYVAGDIAATAVWSTALNQAAREALTTWAAWLAATPAWAVEYTASGSRSDATVGGGNETSRVGTTLVADPSGFFASGSTIEGSAAGTLGTLGGTAVGVVEHPGSTTGALGALSGTAVGVVTHQGAAAGTLGALAGTSAGVVEHPSSAVGTLGALTGTATGTVEHPGAATGTLGALSGTATGTVETSSGATVQGSAAGTLGALTGTATGTVRTPVVIQGSASGMLGGLTGTATGTRSSSTGDVGGGWVDFLAIVRDNDAIMRAERAGRTPPQACPRDGEPLQVASDGMLWCPFDGYRVDPRNVSTQAVAVTG